MDTAALKASLRQALLEYRERRPNLSLRAIARNSGVNRYFLNKLLEDKAVDNTPLDINQILLFLKFITKKNTIQDIMASSSAEVRQVLATIFPSPNLDRVYKTDNETLNLYDYHTYFILHFAAFNNGGIQRRLIEDILGAGARKTLSELLEQNILEEVGDRIKTVADHDFTYPPDVIKHHFANYSRFYDPRHLGRSRNFISVLSQGVNAEALGKIQAIYVDAFRKVDNVMRDKSNWGEIPAFAISCVDTFVDELEDAVNHPEEEEVDDDDDAS